MNIKVPVSWLRDYLKTDLAAKTIADKLSLSGPSVEHIEKLGRDYLLEVEITSNRPDAFSIFGLAREAYAILRANRHQANLVTPHGLNLELDPDLANLLPLEVIIKNKNLCPRFTAIVVDNIKIKPSPAYIRNRLKTCGIRPINNIVDISNYLMLELGQPMHTFDYDKVKGGKMILRSAARGEKIKTLDGKTRSLPQGAIVIQDRQRLIDLCGIMGGTNSQISSRTKRVIIFVQAYDPTVIRKTTQALAFHTEAASRFEKGIDLQAIPSALSRAVYLAKQTAGAKIASELIDIVNTRVNQPVIALSLKKLSNYLDIEIPPETAAKNLELLGFRTRLTAQTITATAPSWRLPDIENDVDLIEEIARIYGYWRLPSKLPQGTIPNKEEGDLTKVIRIKRALKFLGLTEIISYSIISKEFLKLSAIDLENSVEIANPLSDQWQFMRPTLLISQIAAIAQNQHLGNNLKLFEAAKTYFAQEKNLPQQDLHLAITLQNATFSQIKGIVENVFEFQEKEIRFQKPKRQNSTFKKEQSAQIVISEKHVGTIGLISDHILDHFEIEASVAAAEINLTTCFSLPSVRKAYKPVAKYPPVIEDLSAIFDQKALFADIISEIKKAGGPHFVKIEAIDIFTSEKIGKDKKSITFRLTYQKLTATPTHEEVNTARDKIIDALGKSFRAIVRR